jgi:hypothetical protein
VDGSTGNHPLSLLSTYSSTQHQSKPQQYPSRTAGSDTFKHTGKMSDKETEDDVGLPKATVFKLIQGPSALCPQEEQANITEILPPDLGCTKEAKDVLVDCCVGEYFRHSNGCD